MRLVAAFLFRTSRGAPRARRNSIWTLSCRSNSRLLSKSPLPRDSSGAHLREKANPGLLLRPCVIASSCMHPQRWHFLGKERQLDFDLPPLTVTSKVARTVGKYILVAQLKPDVLSDNREPVGTIKGV